MSKSIEAKGPEGLVNLEPRGMVGMIYVEDHQTLLYTKYISCGPYGYLFVCLFLYVPSTIFQLKRAGLPGLNQY